MLKQAVKGKSSVVWIFMPLIFIVALVAGGRALNLSRSQQVSPQVNNLTKAFQVIGLVQEEYGYLLTLKNISGKPINGYAIATNARAKRTFDLTTGDRVVSPEEVTEIKIPSAQLNLPSGGSAQQGQITVLAVTFEDHSDEGEPQTLLEIKGRRLGIKQQLNRVIPLLEAAMASPEADKPTVLNRLKSQISALIDEPDAGASAYMRTGLRNVKEGVLLEIQKLEQSGNIREGLGRLHSYMKKRASRL